MAWLTTVVGLLTIILASFCAMWHVAVLVELGGFPVPPESEIYPFGTLFVLSALALGTISFCLIDSKSSWRLWGIYLATLVVFALSCSYYPRYNSDIVWRKNGQLVESTFSWPFTKIRLIPKLYPITMSMSTGGGTLQVVANYRPEESALLASDPEIIWATLKNHIGSHLEAAGSGKDPLPRLQTSLPMLPEKLSGKISGKIQLLSSTGQIISELSFSNDVSLETSSFLSIMAGLTGWFGSISIPIIEKFPGKEGSDEKVSFGGNDHGWSGRFDGKGGGKRLGGTGSEGLSGIAGSKSGRSKFVPGAGSE